MTRFLALAGATLITQACDGTTSSDRVGDAAVADGHADAIRPDSRTAEVCDHTGFQWAYQKARANAELLQFSAIDNLAGDPTDALQVQRFYTLGATRSDQPQLITLTDENYADCSTCVLVFHGCTLGATVFDPLSCSKTYLARAGTVELTYEGAPGGELLGFLHDVELVQVTINFDTFQSTKVPNGETWCLTSFKFEDPVIELYN